MLMLQLLLRIIPVWTIVLWPAAALAAFSDTDLPGNTYRSFQLVSPVPSFCERACKRDGKCRAWTFSWPGKRGKRAMCFLKTAASTKRRDTCCVSGMRSLLATPLPEKKPELAPPPASARQPQPPEKKTKKITRESPPSITPPRPEPAKQAFCTRYADLAMQARQANARHACGYRGGRWNASRRGYYNWCLNNPRAAAERNTQARRRAIARCVAALQQPPRPEPPRPTARLRERIVGTLRELESCSTYTARALAMVRRARRNGCGFTGRRWTLNPLPHFEACRRLTLPQRAREIARLRARVKRCRLSGAERPYAPPRPARFRWVKIGGPGPDWRTRWYPARSGRCRLVRHCRCPVGNTCGGYRDGQQTIYWPDGCAAQPTLLRCQVR